MSDVLKGAGQEIIGMIATCEDITHRKGIEDKLREREQKYRSLVDLPMIPYTWSIAFANTSSSTGSIHQESEYRKASI